MRKSGLRVDPIDASIEMVKLANSLYNLKARQAEFSDIDGEDIYALVSSFDKKDEVYLIRNDEDEKFSAFNKNFHNN